MQQTSLPDCSFEGLRHIAADDLAAFHVPPEDTLCHYFEKTIHSHADDTALLWDGGSLSFREFGYAVDSLRNRILQLTNGKRQVIGLYAERSPEMYVAIYAIVTAGCAYLPLSPQLPGQRISHMLRDSGAAIVLLQSPASMPDFVTTVSLWESAQESSVQQTPQVVAEDIAYILYTSGSTGAPKGVAISHGSIVNRIRWMHRQYPTKDPFVILQKTPFTFDVSLWEIFWWGMFGGTMAILPPNDHYHPKKLVETIYQLQVTHIHFVPSMFGLFLAHLHNHPEQIAMLASLQHIFLSGEALMADSVRGFYAMAECRHILLHNLYGPTECTVDVTFHDCTMDQPDPVPIGRPVSGTAIYILDKFLHPVPPEVMGHLYIGGVNVSPGYINNPTLTAQRFISNPFGTGRLYHTGDLAMWDPQGNILFCGRADHQLKVGGQRIEAGEIEHAISALTGIVSAAVILKNNRLTAFYTGTPYASAQIRSELLATLPSYMIPASFCHLPELPITSNGKLDRQALLAAANDHCEIASGRMPNTEQEQRLVSLFARILGKQDVTADTDFLLNGGTSLDIISAMAAEPLLEQLTVAEFMANPTPAALAAYLARKNQSQTLQCLFHCDNAKAALILFPFAGGDASAFTALLSALRKRASFLSVYCAGWEESANPQALADAVKELSIPCWFYSHCAGSAPAMQIAAVLREIPDNPLKGIFIGASMPPVLALKRNIWRGIPKKLLLMLLKTVGLPSAVWHDDTFYSLFLSHTDRFFPAMENLKKTIPTPVTVIASQNDLFTFCPRLSCKRWQRYFDKPIQYIPMEHAGHYFQTSHADSLAEHLLKNMQTASHS